MWYNVAESTRCANSSKFSENRRCERSCRWIGTPRPVRILRLRAAAQTITGLYSDSTVTRQIASPPPGPRADTASAGSSTSPNRVLHAGAARNSEFRDASNADQLGAVGQPCEAFPDTISKSCALRRKSSPTRELRSYRACNQAQQMLPASPALLVTPTSSTR